MGLAAATTAEAEDIVEALFTTPEGTSNPYPLHTRVRTLAPIHQSAMTDSWVVSRYRDMFEIFRQRAFIRDITKLPTVAGNPPELERPFNKSQAHWLALENPPNHTRMRAHMNHVFSTRVVESFLSRTMKFTISARSGGRRRCSSPATSRQSSPATKVARAASTI